MFEKQPTHEVKTETPVFRDITEIPQDERDFLLSLEPNFDPQVVIDAGYEMPPIFFYGTLLPDEAAGGHIKDHVDLTSASTAALPGFKLLGQTRFTGENVDSKKPDAPAEFFRFPYTRPGSAGDVVKGVLFKLHDHQEDGIVVRSIADYLKKEDKYEETEAGIYQRQIQVVEMDNKQTLAMVYIGQKTLEDRDHMIPINKDLDHWSGNINPDNPNEQVVALYDRKSDAPIPDGDFSRWNQDSDKTT